MELSQQKVINQLTQIDEYEFEQFIADLWERQGWSTKVTQGSNDRGIDIIATKTHPFFQKQVIQAKKYSTDNTIGSPAIQQYSSLQHQEDGVDAVVIVTTSSFSSPARKTARDLNVKLVNGKKLHNILSDTNSEGLFYKYTSSDSQSLAKGKTADRAESGHKNDSDFSKETPNDVVQNHSNQIKGVNHPFDDHTLSERKISKTDFFGRKCPVCSTSNSVWEQEADSREDRRYKCESCETYWEPKKTFVFRTKKWKAVTGPMKGKSMKLDSWRDK